MFETKKGRVSRRRALKLCAVSGGAALATTGVVAGDEDRSKENELFLVECGVWYQPTGDSLDVTLRMPVDFAPKYRFVPDGIMPTPQAAQDERQRMFESNAAVSNGRIHQMGREYGGSSDQGYLPVRLRYGRQPVDAAPVAEDVVHPEYNVRRNDSTVAVRTDGQSKEIDPGNEAELRLSEQTYTVTKHIAVETEGQTTQPMEGEDTRYRHEVRTAERRFIPTLTVENYGRVGVWKRGN